MEDLKLFYASNASVERRVGRENIYMFRVSGGVEAYLEGCS